MRWLDILVGLCLGGVGGSFLFGAIWPTRFAYGWLQYQLRRERSNAKRQMIRIAAGIGGAGALLAGIAILASGVVAGLPIYTIVGIGLMLLVLSVIVTYFR